MGDTGNLTLNETTVSGGVTAGSFPYFYSFGGGVHNRGTLTLSDSTISGNTASSSRHRGGGVYNTNSATATLTNSIVSGNSGGSYAGGVSNGGNLAIANSTISGNSAYFGGGVHNRGSLILSNSTVSGNSAGFGGGVYNNGTLSLTDSTVSGNTAPAGAEVVVSGGTLTADNFNLFGHSGLTNAQAFENFTSGASDLTATSDCTTPTPLANIGNTMGDNGGPTQTHALVADSPAIDAAGPGCPPPDEDQRGVARPQGAACDIGAFEQGAPGLTVSGSCPGQVTLAISGASPGGSVALVRGSGPGSFTVPGGPCQGSVLGLEDVQLVGVRAADPNGEFQGTASVPGSACGIPLPPTSQPAPPERGEHSIVSWFTTRLMVERISFTSRKY